MAKQPLTTARAKLADHDRAITTRTPARPAGAASAVDAAAVRAWAIDNGYQVRPIGRIPNDVLNAWREATLGAIQPHGDEHAS